MKAMLDALKNRRMMKAQPDHLDQGDDNDEMIKVLSDDDQGIDDQDPMSSDLAPELPGHALENGDAGHADEAQDLAMLEKMFAGGADLNNKGFMGKGAALMKAKLDAMKKR